MRKTPNVILARWLLFAVTGVAFSLTIVSGTATDSTANPVGAECQFSECTLTWANAPEDEIESWLFEYDVIGTSSGQRFGLAVRATAEAYDTDNASNPTPSIFHLPSGTQINVFSSLIISGISTPILLIVDGEPFSIIRMLGIFTGIYGIPTVTYGLLMLDNARSPPPHTRNRYTHRGWR